MITHPLHRVGRPASRARLALGLSLPLAAFSVSCDTGGGGGTMVDAAQDPVTPVVELSSCPSMVDAEISDTPTMFVPNAVTISTGEVVKFVITAEHFVLPNTLVMTDDALRVDRGRTQCFQFNVAATYGFLCGAHGFTGSITVQ